MNAYGVTLTLEVAKSHELMFGPQATPIVNIEFFFMKCLARNVLDLFLIFNEGFCVFRLECKEEKALSCNTNELQHGSLDECSSSFEGEGARIQFRDEMLHEF